MHDQLKWQMGSSILSDLGRYNPGDVQEANDLARIIDLLETQPDCFLRSCFAPGHVTGSALLISRDGSRVLMNHHRSLDKWLCFGGHADGESDIFNVARREVIEESGIAGIEPIITQIFDVDVHPIPANPRKGEPLHEHFDVRYLFRVTGDEDFAISDESTDMKWCDYDEAYGLCAPPEQSRMRRMLDKWRKMSQRT